MWNNVSKPTGTPYTNVQAYLPVYDESSISYNDSSVFFNGYDMSVYTQVAKPSGGAFLVPGMATGVLGPPTYSISRDASPWNLVSKPL